MNEWLVIFFNDEVLLNSGQFANDILSFLFSYLYFHYGSSVPFEITFSMF